MTDNIIEIVNNDCIIEIEEANYNLCVDNIIVSDYDYVLNKPKINSVEIIGNKQPSDLGLVATEELLTKANVDLDNLSLLGQSVLDNKANSSLNNLTEDAEKHFLNKAQITNCLINVPQKIKLELNNGTLTLKAGSKVIVPNGFESDGTTPKFDEVTTTNDFNFTYAGEIKIVAYLQNNGTAGGINGLSACNSGATDTGVNYHLWYDTANNVIRRYNESTMIENNCSFPFCIYDGQTQITSIDQIFNGMGYIGSTVWVDKGIKGLIPDGRNADGSLKNIEVTTSKVRTMDVQYTDGLDVGILSNGGLTYNTFNALQGDFYVKSLKYAPTPSNYSRLYVEDENQWYYTYGQNKWTKGSNFVNVTKAYCGNDLKITKLDTKTAFHAIDYNDKSTISGWGMPSNRSVDLTLGASGSSYTAPTNGWFCLSKKSTGGGQVANLINVPSSSIRTAQFATASGQDIYIYLPARKGDTVTSYYSLGGATEFFKFIYAQGEQ